MLTEQVTFRDTESSPALETDIREKMEKLSKYYKRIMHCRVTVDLPNKQQNHGKLFTLKILLSVPGKELVVSKTNEDIYLALRDAFNAMARQLEELSRIRRGDVKSHTICVHGSITRLNMKEGYGFIDGIDGNEYYFSISNVSHPNFEQLNVGDRVEFFPRGANDGHHAHHVVREHEVE